MPNPNPEGNFDQRPFAGSAWVTNQDAAQILANQRMTQRLPPPWYRPATHEQVRRRAIRKMIRHYLRAAWYAALVQRASAGRAFKASGEQRRPCAVPDPCGA
jgi:hypothetical protein